MHRSYSVAAYDDLEVMWLPELDGGGLAASRIFNALVAGLFGHVGHVYEACAGCGFIGFSLLAGGLCDRLTLSDINPDAVDAMTETVRRNGLHDKVEVYLSDGLASLPKSLRFDLVVSNPPWYTADTGSLITDDLDWAFHRAFYANIADYLSAGASLLFLENSGGAEPELFAPMLAAGGLANVQTLRHADDPNPAHYFVWSKPVPSQLIMRAMAPPEAIVLELTANPKEYELQSDYWYRGTVVNRFGRPINMILSGAAGEGVCMPLPADSSVELPSFVLPAGEYRIRDGLTDAELATIRVPTGRVPTGVPRIDKTPADRPQFDANWPRTAPPDHLVLELSPERTEYELPPSGGYTGTLVNRLDRPVQLVLRDANGRQFGGILPLPVGASLEISSVSLAPGRYLLHDALTDSSVLAIQVRPSP